VNAIAAVTARGAFWYRTSTGRLNALTFEGFLRAFLTRRRHRVLLVLDRHPAHIATRIARFVQAQRGRVELHFLPGYAPDLNPDAFVWNSVRQQGVPKTPLRRDASLHERVARDLAAIKARPALVRSFFHADSVAYILD
jgi:hypothetical protein